MTHAWCSDPARDEAVRAAEDNRQGPLPTLEEAIATITRKGNRMTKSEAQAAEYRAEAKDRAEPNGLRTERVVLEVTMPASHQQLHPKVWPWKSMLSKWGFGYSPGESVRVFEEDARSITQNLAADRFASAVAEADTLSARVASLEEQLEIAACRAATAENRVAELEQNRERFEAALEEARTAEQIAEALLRRYGLNGTVQRLEAMCKDSGKTVVWEEFEDNQENTDGTTDGMAVSPVVDVSGHRDLCGQTPGSAEVAGGLAPAASVAANGPAGPESSEPDAWGVRRKGGVGGVVHRLFRSSAEQSAEQYGGTVVPLYTAPPPARGWLTEEEREAVEAARATFSLGCAGMPEDGGWYKLHKRRQDAMLAILDRSTPPEVVLPKKPLTFRYENNAIRNRDGRWLEALAAAGVKVKEVGRE